MSITNPRKAELIAEYGTISLARHTASFQCELLATPVNFLFEHLEHVFSFLHRTARHHCHQRLPETDRAMTFIFLEKMHR